LRYRFLALLLLKRFQRLALGLQQLLHLGHLLLHGGGLGLRLFFGRRGRGLRWLGLVGVGHGARGAVRCGAAVSSLGYVQFLGSRRASLLGALEQDLVFFCCPLQRLQGTVRRQFGYR
jgi:hypothetical protein